MDGNCGYVASGGRWRMTLSVLISKLKAFRAEVGHSEVASRHRWL